MTKKGSKLITLQRKMTDIKDKLRIRLKSKKPHPELEPNKNTSDFVWIGGFNLRTLPRTPEPSMKRKLSFSDDDDEVSDDDDDDDVLSPATIQLQMAWYRNFHIRFFEDDVSVPSPSKKSKKEIKIPNRGILPTSTPVPRPSDVQAQLKAFRHFFDPVHSGPKGPDFKIYDDYHYPSTPLLNRKSDYRNLVPGNTPAPPLPPRNFQKSRPPMVFRTYKEASVDPLKLNFNTVPLKKSYSTDCLQYSYLL